MFGLISFIDIKSHFFLYEITCKIYISVESFRRVPVAMEIDVDFINTCCLIRTILNDSHEIYYCVVMNSLNGHF